jgi:hypothetical protein
MVERMAVAVVSEPATLQLLAMTPIKKMRLHLQQDLRLCFFLRKTMSDKRPKHIFLNLLIRPKSLSRDLFRNSSIRQHFHPSQLNTIILTPSTFQTQAYPSPTAEDF